MSDAERAQALQRAKDHVEKLAQQLEPFYAAKLCPKDFEPCRGPRCMFFLPEASMVEGQEKPVLTGGDCAVPVIAAQVGPIGNGIFQLLESNSAPGGSHIIR